MRRLIALAVICSCLSTVFADEVYFTNGDKLTGKIKSMTDGKMIIESELAGEITVPMANVATFKTDEPITVNLADGTTLNQKAATAETGKFGISPDGALQAQDFEIASIDSINPPEKPKPAWHGDLSAGFTSTHGNTATQTRAISFNAKKRTEDDRTTLSADYLKGKQENPDTGEEITTEDSWRMQAKYDYFFTQKLFGYLDGRYEKDRIAELDRRTILGLGAGYQWVETDEFNFSTEAGLASVYERYDGSSDSTSNISAQLGYHLDKKLNDKITFINDLTYYPSLDKVSDYYLTSTAELRAAITEKMFANFRVILDYDVTPAEGSKTTDLKYILGIGWSF